MKLVRARAESCPDRFVSLANKLADASGAIVRRYFRTRLEVIGKEDTSPVTIADRKAETKLRQLIERAHPDHGILGEEHGAHRLDAEYVWVLDPIDGTKSFISGMPLFGTLIALLRRGRPILGVIDQPVLRERWVGATGRPTTFCGRRTTTRACRAINQATLYSTAPSMFDGRDAKPYARLGKAVKLQRFGGDCYAYAQVASGNIDLVVEAKLKPYDYLAQVAVIGGAGGIITDWQGKPLGLHSDGRVLASGDRKLHKSVLRVLAV